MIKHLLPLLLVLQCLTALSASPVSRPLDSGTLCPSPALAGYPLPLAAHWNVSEDGFSPAWQIKMIKAGAPLLPWLPMPAPLNSTGEPDPTDKWVATYEPVIREIARLGLPLSFIGTQWENLLTNDEAYFKRPTKFNPNVVSPGGEVSKKVTPFGPVEPWAEVGKRWTNTGTFKKIQELYPNPPCVIFVSNNEHTRLRWHEVETDVHYLKQFGWGRDAEFKRKVVGDGWIERYRAMQEGMRAGLDRKQWKDKTYFVGYDAFLPSAIGRWNGWINYSLITPGRIDPGPLMWDGASPSYYTHNWDSSTDYTVMSPQVQAMNWVFMLELAKQINPKFWFEMSVWDGYMAGKPDSKRKVYADRGQKYGPERYAGWAEFGMWLLRPRVVREFRGWREPLADSEPYFLALLESLSRIRNAVELSDFWKHGSLVANTAYPHPYQVALPKEVAIASRWFLLDTDRDPPRPWTLGTTLPVLALAIVRGEKPNRRWLVYAHAPLGNVAGVKLSVPDFGSVMMDVSEGGTRMIVVEEQVAVHAASPNIYQ
jgi:hypothetical protein